jgi:putative ABC transport system permease protein
VANLVRDPGRTAVMTIAVGSAVAVAFLVASSRISIHDAIAHGIAVGNPREVQVSTLAPDNTINIDAKPSAALVARLAATPGVSSIDRNVAMLTGHTNAGLIGVSAYDRPWLPFPLIAGTKDRASYERGNVLVGAGLARAHHLRPGSRLRLDTPTGYAFVTVGGIWGNGNFNGRVVDMPMALLERLYGPQPADAVGVIAAPGQSVTGLAHRIRAANLDPGLRIDTPAQLVARVSNDVSRQLAPFDALQRGLLVVAFVAVLSTLLLVGVQRHRELGLLAAVGMEPSQLSFMTLAEAAAVGVIAVLLSVVGAAGMTVAFYFVVPIIVGFHDPLRFSFGSLAVSGPAAIIVVMAAAALPAWRTSRLEVLEALQYE